MNKPELIAALEGSLSVAKKIVQMRAVGLPMSTDLDLAIAAQGGFLLSEALHLENAETTNVNAHAIAKSAARAVKLEVKASGAVYKTSGDLLEVKFPNNQVKWLTFGVKITSPGAAAVIPGKVMDGSVVNSPFVGKGIMHFHHLANADYYKIYETQGIAVYPTGFYPANPPTFDSSLGGEVTPKNTDVLTNWVVIAHNSAGDGPPSDPFGTTIHSS